MPKGRTSTKTIKYDGLVFDFRLYNFHPTQPDLRRFSVAVSTFYGVSSGDFPALQLHKILSSSKKMELRKKTIFIENELMS
jgi:hypothetical protein